MKVKLFLDCGDEANFWWFLEHPTRGKRIEISHHDSYKTKAGAKRAALRVAKELGLEIVNEEEV